MRKQQQIRTRHRAAKLRLAAQCLKPAFAILAALAATGSAWATADYLAWHQAFESDDGYTTTQYWTQGSIDHTLLVTSAGTNDAIDPSTDTRVDENGIVSTYFNLGKKAGSGSSTNPNTTPLCGTYTLPEVLATADEFELSFDCWVGAPYYGTAPLGFALRSGSDNVFVMYAIGNSSTGHIKYWAQAASDYSDANATDAKITVPGRGFNPKDNAYWHHIVVSGNRTDGTMSIKVTRPLVDSTTVFDQTVKFANISSVYMVLRSTGKNYTSYMAFDNFFVYTSRPAGMPNAPVISADEGTGKYVRTITITADEGATVTYKIDDGEEQTYTGPFSLPNSGKVYAYATKNDISSETVSEYYYSNLQVITLNAPTSITRRGFNRVYAIASQNDKTGAPVPTFAYQGGSMTAESSTVASASTHSAVMHVDGFDDSSTVAIRATNSDYADSVTVNFSAVDLSVPTSGKYAKYEIDFLQYFTDNGTSVSVGDEISDGYRNILSSSKSEIYDKVLFTESARWGGSVADGLTRGNVNSYIKFLNLAAGDLIYVNASGVSATSNCAKETTYSSGHEVVFSVSQNGDAVIMMSKNTDLYAIRVYAQAVASVDGCGIGSLDDLSAKVSRGSVITVFDSSITLEDLATAVGDAYELEAVSGETDKYTVVAKLNAPTLHRYGLTRLYATLLESSVDGSPVATINYLGGTMASAQTQATAASDESKAIVVSGLDSNGSSAEVWATADGYADSAKTTYTSYSVSASSYAKVYEFDYVEYCTKNNGNGNLWYTDDGGYDSDGNYTEVVEDMEYRGIKVNNVNTILSNPLWFQNISNNGYPRWRTLNQTALNLQTLSGTILFKAMKSGALIYVNADSPSNPVNMTLTSSSNAKEYLYTVNSTLDGSTVDAKLTFAGNSNIYAIRIYVPSVATVGNVGYASLADAAAAASAGDTVTLVANNTEAAVTLPAGVTLALGAFTLENTPTTVDGYVVGFKNGTYTSYVNTTAETWCGTSGTAWNVASNWDKGFVPLATTPVTLPTGDYTIQITGWGAAASCGMEVVGNVNFTQTGAANDPYNIDVYGNITGEGTITLNDVGLWNGTASSGSPVAAATLTVAPAITISAATATGGFSRLDGNGFTLNGALTVNGVFRSYGTHNTFGDMTVNGGFYTSTTTRDTFTGNIVVANNARFDAWNRKGYEFNGAVFTGNGANGAQLWIGNQDDEANDPYVTGTGLTVKGKVNMWFDLSTGDAKKTDKTAEIRVPVKLDTGATLYLGNNIAVGTGGSVATLNAYDILKTDGSGPVTYTTANSVAYFEDGPVYFETLANAWATAKTGGQWITLRAQPEVSDTVTLAAGEEIVIKLGDYSVEGRILCVEGATVQQSDKGYGATGFKAVGAVVVDTTVAPNATSIEYATEKEATTAAAGYTVALTAEQTEQGLLASYYTTAVVPGATEGTYVVMAVLSNEVKPEVDEGVTVTGTTVTLPVTNLKPGLCYRVVSGSVAGELTTEGEWSDYYDGEHAPELTATLPESGVLYYSVEASDTK